MRIIDLFSGCGGMSLGFQNAGFEVVSAFDNWDKAIEIYSKNFSHPIFKRDLSDTSDLSDFKNLNPDIIIGGPPCQDFSSAGKRDETLGRSDLTIKYAETIKELQPKYFVMENVERILKSNAYKETYKIFKDANYGLSYEVLDASLCGVPQKRKRFFLIGELNGEDNAFTPYLLKNLSEKPMTIRDYLGDSLNLDYYYRHPRTYQRRGIFSIDEPSPTVRGVNRPMPSGYPGHPGDPTDNYENVRPLTTIERSYLQTFPESFIFDGIAKTHLEQMIGNAVPVKLAEYVASALKEYIDDKERNEIKKYLVNENKDETQYQLQLNI
ncbi:DNA cytosine methyltransferase [Priestia megaterium]|uniref:DNA cytosine methyltransferase n=1 Tax=Priestia megaterium TaxID=1404 RepID=UPI00046F32B8|nr:DNA cytosine methyltransferase [Priestia megaterium]